MDAHSGQIVAVTLTGQDVDDPSQVGPLLDQIPTEIGQVSADGAYDGEPTYATIAARSADIDVVIPPRATSTAPPDLGMDASRWQEVNGYGRRALVETTMGRYKSLIGTRLRARNDAGRRTEAVVGAAVLNRMLAAGRPNSVRSARGAT